MDEGKSLFFGHGALDQRGVATCRVDAIERHLRPKAGGRPQRKRKGGWGALCNVYYDENAISFFFLYLRVHVFGARIAFSTIRASGGMGTVSGSALRATW